ncbi:MAG: HEAT repeat domain-containing protein [Acidobacteriota bacterium]|nr:HEAT repeat domain-containing protein [Acidobacteriota bacterium]
MNGWRKPVISALLMVAPVLAQETELQLKAQIDAEEAMARAQEGLAKAQTFFNGTGFQMPNLNLDLQGLKSNLLALQVQPMGLQRATARGERANLSYDRGTRALDDHQYEEAIRIFDAVINEKSGRADGAFYWKAYALNRIGRRDEALAAVSALRRDYPNSRWLTDAQALEAEAKQGSGQAVSPGQESNEDLKLMAINSLMNADPERAMPLLEGILKGSSTPRVKDRALFVLTQNRSPRAQQILTDYAKGAGNPDLQMRAIRYLGMSGTAETQQQLVSVYSSSNDSAVKREIIRSLMTSRGKDPLFNLAKSEKDEALRGEAISQLGVMRATDQLTQLYTQETSVDNKVRIVHSLFAAGASDKLMELVRTEKEPRVRAEAIRSFAMSPSTSPETLAGLYASDGEAKTKKEIVNGLFSRGDGKLLVDLARKENDPAMKKYIVERLSQMHTKEATDYMMELLK